MHTKSVLQPLKNNAMADENPTPAYQEIKPRFGRLLSVCVIAVLFCGGLVWFAGTYLLDCCGP